MKVTLEKKVVEIVGELYFEDRGEGRVSVCLRDPKADKEYDYYICMIDLKKGLIHGNRSIHIDGVAQEFKWGGHR